MTREELTAWALKNGWQMIADALSLVKPTQPTVAIVRMVFKGTVVNLEIKKPSGKWDKVSGAAYDAIEFDEDANLPRGLGIDKITGVTKLMQDNKDRLAFSKFAPGKD